MQTEVRVVFEAGQKNDEYRFALFYPPGSTKPRFMGKLRFVSLADASDAAKRVIEKTARRLSR
jgi:hypothetical protein